MLSKLARRHSVDARGSAVSLDGRQRHLDVGRPDDFFHQLLVHCFLS